MIEHYRLKYPLTSSFHGPEGDREERVDEVSLRRLNGKDMLSIDALQDRPMAMTLSMIEAMTGLSRRQVEQLDAEDVMALGELVAGMLPAGHSTGATS